MSTNLEDLWALARIDKTELPAMLAALGFRDCGGELFGAPAQAIRIGCRRVADTDHWSVVVHGSQERGYRVAVIDHHEYPRHGKTTPVELWDTRYQRDAKWDGIACTPESLLEVVGALTRGAR